MTLFQCGGGGHHPPNLARVPDVNLIRVKCSEFVNFAGTNNFESILGCIKNRQMEAQFATRRHGIPWPSI